MPRIGTGIGASRFSVGFPAVRLPNERLWLQATLGVFSDAGATPATDSGAVQQWNDQSDAAPRNVSQATSGNRPVYHSALPSLTFDVSNDHQKYAGALPDTLGSVAI